MVLTHAGEPVSNHSQVLMRGPNVPDPRNPDTIRKSHSTVALTRQAIHDGSVPRLVPRSTGKGAQLHDAAAPVADIKVDAPGEKAALQVSLGHPRPLHLCAMHSAGRCPHHARRIFPHVLARQAGSGF